MDVNNCKYHKEDDSCSIDGNPCFNVNGFENWQCQDYEIKENEEYNDL
jgi:hypothetical protein